MKPSIFEVSHKSQTKMFDCWYACIQMLLTYRKGEKAKPCGNAVKSHRNIFGIGRKLSFGSGTGNLVMRDNGLVAIGHELDVDDIDSVKNLLDKYGPLIAGGGFGPCGAGHFVVICGVNTETNMVYRDNPAWGYGKAWKSIGYLKKVWKDSSDLNILSEAIVALKPLPK